MLAAFPPKHIPLLCLSSSFLSLSHAKKEVYKKGRLFRQPFLCFTLFFDIRSGIPRYRDINRSVPSGVGLFGGFCAKVHVEDLLSESDALRCYLQKLIVVDEFKRLLERKNFRRSETK